MQISSFFVRQLFANNLLCSSFCLFTLSAWWSLLSLLLKTWMKELQSSWGVVTVASSHCLFMSINAFPPLGNFDDNARLFCQENRIFALACRAETTEKSSLPSKEKCLQRKSWRESMRVFVMLTKDGDKEAPHFISFYAVLRHLLCLTMHEIKFLWYTFGSFLFLSRATPFVDSKPSSFMKNASFVNKLSLSDGWALKKKRLFGLRCVQGLEAKIFHATLMTSLKI